MNTSVLFDHDGALEDFTALLLLLTIPNIDLIGITVTPANCLVAPGVSVTRKILDFAARIDVSCAGGSLDGPNPFPLAWRTDSLKVNELPILNRTPGPDSPLDERPAHEFMAAALLEAEEPVVLVAVGPLTNVAWCLEHHPEVADKISEIVFMGGALHVAGNVDQPGHDATAEWNVYWDPPAAKRVWDTSIPITMFPLDATNRVEVTSEFCRRLAQLYEHPFSALAGTIWAMSFGTIETTNLPYFCWDSATVAYLTAPELFEYADIRTDIVLEGPSQGRTVVVGDGRQLKAAVRADAEGFYELCLEAFRR